MVENANPSSGIKDEASFEAFATEYEKFLKKCEEEGCSSSPSRVSSRSPLQLALMISPLYLLNTARLSLKSFHRRSIIDVAAKLGPKKPSLILTIENLIWDAIFKLAEGHSTVYDIIRELVESLPWSEIDGELIPGAREWFYVDSGMLSLFYLEKEKFIN